MKLLPGQLLDIQQTVRETHPPPLPHRPPLPSFDDSPSFESPSVESPYAHIDGESDSEPDVEDTTAVKEREAAEENVETDR